jgi:hypothetical protein
VPDERSAHNSQGVKNLVQPVGQVGCSPERPDASGAQAKLADRLAPGTITGLY